MFLWLFSSVDVGDEMPLLTINIGQLLSGWILCPPIPLAKIWIPRVITKHGACQRYQGLEFGRAIRPSSQGGNRQRRLLLPAFRLPELGGADTSLSKLPSLGVRAAQTNWDFCSVWGCWESGEHVYYGNWTWNDWSCVSFMYFFHNLIFSNPKLWHDFCI